MDSVIAHLRYSLVRCSAPTLTATAISMVLLPTPNGGRGVGSWRAEIDFAAHFVADAPNSISPATIPLNQHGSGGGPMSLRQVLVGLIEEYARHMGHVDLLRERIDGRLGQ